MSKNIYSIKITAELQTKAHHHYTSIFYFLTRQRLPPRACPSQPVPGKKDHMKLNRYASYLLSSFLVNIAVKMEHPKNMLSTQKLLKFQDPKVSMIKIGAVCILCMTKLLTIVFTFLYELLKCFFCYYGLALQTKLGSGFEQKTDGSQFGGVKNSECMTISTQSELKKIPP
jgi:hypothetical protein